MNFKISITQAAEDYYNKGLYYGYDSQFAQGLEDFRIKLEADPNDAETYSQMGIFFIRNGNFTDAVATLREALRLAPENAEYFMHAGVAYYKQGNYNQAARLFQKATYLKRDYVDVYFRLGNCYEMMGDPNLLHKACAAYRQALRYSPDDFKTLVGLGAASAMMGNYDQSVSALERAEKIDGNEPVLLYNLANSYYYKGNYNRAIACYEKALSIQPDFSMARTNLECVKNKRDGVEE